MARVKNYWDRRGRGVVFFLASFSISVFSIPVTVRFIFVTVAAHAIFGVGLGTSIRGLARGNSSQPLMAST